MRLTDDLRNDIIVMEEPDVMESIRKILINQIDHRRLSRLAERSGLSTTQLSKIAHEEGRTTTVRSAEMILNALGYELRIVRRRI